MVRYKGKDQIEFGYKDYSEASYGGSPGATPTTLYRVGHVSEMTPMYDPELSRVFVLRDSTTPAPLALARRRENVGLRISWLQGTLGTYWQTQMLAGDIFFAGLIALEVIHIVLLGTWNEVVFNGIMLVVGTIVGAVWGRQNG